MWLNEPLWLLALVPAIPMLLWEFLAHRESRSNGNPVEPAEFSEKKRKLGRLVALRLTAVILVILAMSGFSVFMPTRHLSVAVLLDVSGSIDRREMERERGQALRWIRRLNAGDRVAVIGFAGRARILVPLTTPAAAVAQLESADLDGTQTDRTDLQAALRTAREQLRNAYGNRSIILFSDGRPNSGGLESGFGTTGMVEIPIYAVPIGQPGRDLIARNLLIPERLRQGENAALIWEIQNDRPQNVNVTLKVDGRPVSTRTMSIASGSQSVRLDLPSQSPGIHRVDLIVTDASGRRLTQAESGGMIRVSGPAQILVVHGDGGTSPISGALTVQGCQVRDTGIAGIQEAAGILNGFSAVVLDNVAATDLEPVQHRRLQSYVAGGGGLVVVGGDHSLGLGEYYETSLEDLLPVSTDTRQRLRFTRANILFVIDHSGSMSDLVGKASKQLAAMKGIVAAADGLNPMDEVGIITFASQTSWVLPFTKASHKDEIKKALDKMDAGGGTEMADALDDAARELAGRGPVAKHVILLTDGITGPERMKAICGKLRAIGATITTIGVGEDVNESLLRSIARWGEGRYYRAKMDQIPKLIIKETVRVTRDLINEGEFVPKLQNASEIVQGLESPLPAVKGYLLTRPKGTADVIWNVGAKGDPLLAVWRYGGGRVAVFTGDSGRRWLAGWSGRAVYNQFWAQLVRAVEKGSADEGLRLSARPEAGRIRLVVEAMDGQRRLLSGLQLVGRSGNGPNGDFRLTEQAPGYYEAILPAEGNGLQEFEVRDTQSGIWTSGGVWNPLGNEYRALGPDRALLGYISAASGGSLLSMKEPSLPAAGWAWTPVPLGFYLILAALLLFLVELGLRSTSLGQIAMFQAAMQVWLQAQARLIAAARGSFGAKRETTVVQNARQMVETNRYLAERRRKRREREGG